MLQTYIYAFASVLIVSLVSLIGVFLLSLKEEIVKKYISLFIGLAVGALLGDAFIHLIPEAFESSVNPTNTSLLIILGILVFFIIEKFLHWHHHEDDSDKKHINPVGRLMLITDGFHNLIDGIIIGASFLVSVPIGLATTLAVFLHEIPQEIGDFTVLIHSGYEKRKALWLNFLSALTAIVGVIIVFIFGNVTLNTISGVLPIAAGGFIYIAVADLIPELQKTKKIKYSILQIASVLIGILAMVALLLFE